MPKRTDIKKILLIGSGPIVIGQGCEFDYSGTQACKVLKEEGYQVVLVNSNPATIMTDPDLADATYIEPILPEVVEKIIEIERPDALLPTLGGQTALNVAVALVENGTLGKYGVQLIGANYESIKKAENRNLFKKAMEKAGLEVPRSGYVRSKEEALAIIEEIGFPAIIRASFTLGGSGGSIAYNREEFEALVEAGIAASPSREILVEESVLGWKEFELELMRDRADNVVIICSIENIDPMGVHTGDSITVAPIQTLSDRQYQKMRDAAIRVIREIGVETGGSNIQFAVSPTDGRMVVIEMNPRVSRSSALSSKATGYPIAKIAAKLAVGYTLDEIPNDITRITPASFEPVIDYVVVKIPRFDFEKFPLANATLSPQMKSVGEAMAIGRTFKESLQKAVQSLEVERPGLVLKRGTVLPKGEEKETLRAKLKTPNWERIFYIAEAFRHGFSVDEIYKESAVDPWFLHQIEEIVRFENELISRTGQEITPLLKKAKEWGFSDIRLADLTGLSEKEIYEIRQKNRLIPVFKRVDTCAAEFEAFTPYLYSTYESECEAVPSKKKKVMILGGGPNRIGQGIEFDYCCVHGVLALKEDGYETIMVNCNPETVSTDYDTADRLYFEPLTFEHVLRIIQLEKPEGVVVQLGGQTPLKLAIPLEEAGIRILGTSPDSIDLAEDRERFRELVERLELLQPESGTARSASEATIISAKIGYPVMVRPSYVLGGRAMRVVYDEQGLFEYMTQAVSASSSRPVLVDKYLEDAIEVDVDALSDGDDVMIGGIMEHIEEAGVHSGDSACSLPPFSLQENLIGEIRRQTILLARALKVVGLLNIQFAVKNGDVYVLEVNPRASRTVPFVSKTIGVPLAKLAIRLMTGKKLKELVKTIEIPPYFHVAVKEAVFPFNKFPGVDTLLGPEMKSTGEVMGIDNDFGKAFAKSQSAAGNPLPLTGKVFLSVKDKDKQGLIPVAKDLERYGFSLIGTRGTVEFLRKHAVTIEMVNKIAEGRPHVVDFMKNREIQLSINTVGDQASQKDSFPIRQTTLQLNIPYFTTMAGARAAVRGIGATLKDKVKVKSLQQYHIK